jgi:hypothetical protein
MLQHFGSGYLVPHHKTANGSGQNREFQHSAEGSTTLTDALQAVCEKEQLVACHRKNQLFFLI